MNWRERVPGMTGLLEALSGARTAPGIPRGALGMCAALLAERSTHPVLFVTHQPELVYADASHWCENGTETVLFPAWDTLPFDSLAPSREVIQHRMRAYERLSHHPEGTLVVTSPDALISPALRVPTYAKLRTQIARGDRRKRNAFIAELVDLGYRATPVVTVPGEFAVRGGIVDLFPAMALMPCRIEWDGDDIDEIRLFRPEDQAARSKRDSLVIPPRSEFLWNPGCRQAAYAVLSHLDLQGMTETARAEWERDLSDLDGGNATERMFRHATLLNAKDPGNPLTLLPGIDVVVDGSVDRLAERIRRHLLEVGELFEREVGHGMLPARYSLGLPAAGDIRTMLDAASARSWTDEGESVVAALPAGKGTLFDALARYGAKPEGLVLCITREAGRVRELLEQQDAAPVLLDSLEGDLPLRGWVLIEGNASRGFEFSQAVSVLTDFELFGRQLRSDSVIRLRGRGKRSVVSTSNRDGEETSSTSFDEVSYAIQFERGDFVVHRDHGIARFVEMRHVEEAGADHEFMVLEYAEGDTLFVPVTHLDRVDRYVGGSQEHPHLSHLGTKEWDRARKKANQKAEEVARSLIEMYSKRELSPGHAFGPDTPWQENLEDSFPYDETEDQELVMREIKRDMEAGKPMDRLVCGDVGFGKTELAIRAAFKAVGEGFQVAVLVPTTVLAQQHYRTFQDRLEAFPVAIRQLSRLCDDADAAATLAGMRAGTVDIVIGTHKLLQKDVTFHNLGLVVIDEEQRFGVLQKERFKELRIAVDVLSLSATPIPRTLHMSLAGIRDLSVIRTPPEDRQPIRTFVAADDDDLVREVVSRELAREGQVYYLHNRVATIVGEAKRVQKLLPHARVGVAHGQMDENELAQIMDRFMAREIDVLCCTTIIESGLDIPNVNTIIVQNAQQLGLAQLYQLRGRVGRSGRRAYAYLLYPPTLSLTEQADKRLDAIEEMQDLGSGFSVAMKDLEIRGAGNLLGEEQHGEIAAVGLELYNRMLRHAILSLKGEMPKEELPRGLVVNLPIDAYLPAPYIESDVVRLKCYQELSACLAEQELASREKDLRDRFGPLPIEVVNLLYVLRLRLRAADVGAESIVADGEKIVVSLPMDHGYDLSRAVMPFGQSAGSTAHRAWIIGRRGFAQPTLEMQLTEWQQRLFDVLSSIRRTGGVLSRV